MQVENFLKIADINSYQFTPEMLDFLKNECEATYRDQVMKEHLYNIQDIFDDKVDEEGFSPDLWQSIREIHTICFDNECGYFRVIFN